MYKYSLVPSDFREKDPRNLPYHFPSIPVVKYAKLMQEFCYFAQLEAAENAAKKAGFILLPFNCMHWQRRKQFTEERKIKIGKYSFFMMKVNELTDSERTKLDDYLEELHEKEIS